MFLNNETAQVTGESGQLSTDNCFQARLRASRCMRPVQARKLNSSQREAQTKLITLLAVKVSAHIPE